MNSRIIKRNNKAKILHVLVLISTFVLLFCFNGIAVYAASEYEAGIYFEIDKNPIESVEITSTSDSNLICGQVVSLSSVVYPENARETVVEEVYKIIDGSKFASIENNKLVVREGSPVGSRIEVVSLVDGVESSNSLVFTVSHTPVSSIEFANDEESIVIGGALKLKTNVYPIDATDKNISYSIVSNTDYMQVSFSGMLSFNGSPIPDGDLSVTVRATSTGTPDVFVEKTFCIRRPVFDTIDATADMTEVNQQGAYSFSARVLYLSEIFGDSPVKYSIDVDSSVAMIDVNGLLYVTPTAPIGSKITVSIDAYDGTKHQQTLVVTPVFATDFTPIVVTEPDAVIADNDYYLPGTSIAFDVVSYSPANVTDINKVFELRVDDESMAYVDGHSVIIKDMSGITTPDPSFTVTVFSEPNGLERTFEINVFVPVASVTLTGKQDRLQENGVYALSDLLDYSVDPINSTIQTVHYFLDNTSDSIAVIRDDNLIVNDDLPTGTVTVRLYVEINGTKSNVVEFDVYKPTHSLDLDVEVNGEVYAESNMPASTKTTADTITLITRVDATASENISQIVVTRGAEYIDGEIQLIKVTDDGVAYFEFVLKKNLVSAEQFDGCIKLYAIQDGVVSEEKEIIIYIPNEDFDIPVVTIQRGCSTFVFNPTIPENVSSKAWEFMLLDDAVSKGIVKVSSDSIYIPPTLKADETFTVYFLVIEDDPRWQSMELKPVTFTIDPASESTKLVYEGNTLSEDKFNIVYGTDNGGDGKKYDDVYISASKPQLWVGGYTDIEIKYLTDFISEYGMTIEHVDVKGPGTWDETASSDSIVRVYMNSNAGGNDFIQITVIVSDGEKEYTLDAGRLYAFRPLSGSLVFDTVTVNGQSIIGLVNKTISNFSFNATYGLGDMKFDFENKGEIAVNNMGRVEIKSFTANKNQIIKYSCQQKYNGKIDIQYSNYSTVKIRTISINKNGGSGGYSELIAVKNMVGLGGNIGYAAPSRNGYMFIGFESYISREGKVIADYYNLKSLSATWLKVQSTVVFSKDSGERNKTITDSDKFTETVYPWLDREQLKAYGFTKLSVTISYDCKEKDDGYQDLWVYSYKDKEVASFTEEHGSGKKDKTWWTHTVSFEISLNEVQTNGSFWLKWGAHGIFGDTWYLGYTEIDITASTDSK